MTDEHAPRGIDFDKPNAARVYDYLIGGKLNYAIDRMFAEQILAVRPESRDLALLNRRWLRRAVRFGAEQGIRQFLDIGSGMPTVGHVHEVVQAIDATAHVVYVDNEPVAVAHSEIVLKGNDNAEMVQADAEIPADVLEHPTTERLLDFDRPLMVIMAAFIHFVPDSRDPAGLVAAYRDVLAPGSYLALSSGTFEGQGEEVRRAAEMYQKSGTEVVARSKAELAALLDGFELVPPGIVFTPQWRPDDPAEVGAHPELASQLALVARKV
ncbi:SAM-dependent methyltransferase [Amycolatopsis sp. OK19-0408]|uniref:SAM-dependent methyltransferase n=1 Tax=Amycolatopsis iheyensis TaxID=2945988 RepID=A0A9X2N6T8_9PSEU|nr:SAM-dependent methyltransferase [Amycolatopsis iheyensis]MCR6481698.1 SAM-dependent methyltransferase [Amycolatopsis iheyensis]